MKILTDVNDFTQIKTTGWVGYDLETTGLDPTRCAILLMSLCTEEETYIIDFTRIDIKHARLLEHIFTDNLILGANLTFDYKFLVHHTGIEIKRMSDVMLNEQLLSAGKFVPAMGKARPFTLAAITMRRLGIQLNKDVREEFINYSGTLSDQAYEYAAQDTVVLKPIYDQQMEEIVSHDLQRVYDLECAIIPVTAYMELTGVMIDRKRLQELEVPFKRYTETCERIFQDMVISGGGANRIVWSDKYYALNSASKPQVLETLNLCGVSVDSLEAKTLAKWDLRNNKETLELLRSRLEHEDSDIAEAIEQFGGYENPYLRAYAFLIGAEKLLGTYVEGIQRKADSKDIFRPWFRQLGARATGRYSSDAQQIPKNDKLARLGLRESIRECIIARPGKSFLIADFSAIELVILADFSGDERLAYEVLHGDVHIVVTQEVLGQFFPIAKEATAKNRKQHPFDILRDFSKTFSYGIAYGVTGKSISEQATTRLASLGLKLTAEQGDLGVAYWKRAFPQAGRFLDASADMATSLGYTTSKLGRKRWFDLNHIAGNKWRYLAARREGSNQRIQSTSADMTKLSQQYFFNIADRSKARIVLTVHDELVVESDDSYVPYAQMMLKTSMEQAARYLLPTLGHAVIVNPAVSKRYDK